MLHQVGVSFDLYYDARKHKIKIYASMSRVQVAVTCTQIDIKVQIDKAKIVATFLQVLSTKMPSA